MPLKLFGSLAASRSQVVFRSPYLDNELVALAYQAPNGLRRSQYHGLSFIRHNSDILSKIPTDKGYTSDGSRLAEVARRCFSRVTFKLDYFYSEGLPHLLSPLDPYLCSFGSTAKMLGLHKYLHYPNPGFGMSWLDTSKTSFGIRELDRCRSGIPLARIFGERAIHGRRIMYPKFNAVLTLEAIERLLFRDMPRGTRDLEYSHTEDSRKESPLSR